MANLTVGCSACQVLPVKFWAIRPRGIEMAMLPEGYSPDTSDASKGSEKVPGDKTTTLAIKEPAAYSRDWSGK
jgi:hypothetical protein